MASILLPICTLVAIVTLSPNLARSECSGEPAPQRQAEAAACHAHCNRVFHREEANHACHQECYAQQYEACQTNSG
jgi:hypothetical protein